MLFQVISKKKNSAPKIVNFRHKISLQHSSRNVKNLLVVEGCSIWMFSEVVFPKCSLKKTFLEISQISTTLLKIDSNTGIFLWKYAKFLRTSFYETPPLAASVFLPGQFLNGSLIVGIQNQNLDSYHLKMLWKVRMWDFDWFHCFVLYIMG